VGRGLRRVSYEFDKEKNLFEPEYVNIFGVPFTFLPHESQDGPPPPPPPPKTKIEPVSEKSEFEINWPNIIRIDHVYRPELKLYFARIKPLELDALKTPTLAEVAPIVEGKPDVTKLSEIALEDLARKFRWQKIAFETASGIYDQMKPNWKGNKKYLLARLIRLMEEFVASGNQDDLRRRLVITLNLGKVVQHMWESIISENTESVVPVFDTERPIVSTGDMRTWYTGKPCEPTKRSHINFCVYDSTWESSDAFQLDRSDRVTAWVKNDHLGFEVLYVYRGVVHKFRPDFIIRLKTGHYLVLETKGQDTDQDKTKREFLDQWVKAANAHGGFGSWHWAVSRQPGDIPGLLS
jgi:type III restriction enzyme